MTLIRRSKTRGRLHYPRHRLKPESFLGFLELPGFLDDWLSLEFDEDDLDALQVMIMSAPEAAPEVPDTGGLRCFEGFQKCGDENCVECLGFANVWYVYFEEHKTVVLVMARDDEGEFTDDEKEAIRDYIAREKAVLAERAVRRKL